MFDVNNFNFIAAWWKGRNQRTDQTGVFPANFCRAYEDASRPSATSATSAVSSHNTFTPTATSTATSAPQTHSNHSQSQASNNTTLQSPITKKCVCLYTYTAQEEGELSFLEGDVLVVLDTGSSDADQWWKGVVQLNSMHIYD